MKLIDFFSVLDEDTLITVEVRVQDMWFERNSMVKLFKADGGEMLNRKVEQAGVMEGRLYIRLSKQ